MSWLVSKQGFWGRLKKPIMALAPMSDITDAAFRYLIASCGKPDVIFTEFVSVDGLCSRGRENLLRELRFNEIERPVVAQFFGIKPKNFYRCAIMAADLGFDGIDINMGCPAKVICKNGGGASLIQEQDLAQEIIRETIRGSGELPVSVKTRIGYNRIEIEEWTAKLVEAGPAAIILHLRTRKEMTKVPAHWELMPQAVEIARGSRTMILGNGDVRSIEQAEKLASETGCDGVMIGRAVLGNPWLFDRTRKYGITLEEKFDAMLQHARLFEKIYEGQRRFMVMRKHLRPYASGFAGARELRIALVQVNCADDVARVLESFRERIGRFQDMES